MNNQALNAKIAIEEDMSIEKMMEMHIKFIDLDIEIYKAKKSLETLQLRSAIGHALWGAFKQDPLEKTISDIDKDIEKAPIAMGFDPKVLVDIKQAVDDEMNPEQWHFRSVMGHMKLRQVPTENKIDKMGHEIDGKPKTVGIDLEVLEKIKQIVDELYSEASDEEREYKKDHEYC